jgi:hypothetical protein
MEFHESETIIHKGPPALDRLRLGRLAPLARRQPTPVTTNLAQEGRNQSVALSSKFLTQLRNRMRFLRSTAMHGTVLSGANTQISGDAPGIVAEYVQQKLGAPLLYVNGAAGNIAPIYRGYPDFESGHLSQFRVLLSDPILEANARLGPTTSQVALTLGEKIVETPRKAGHGLGSRPRRLPAHNQHRSHDDSPSSPLFADE